MEIMFFCPIWGLVPDYNERIDGNIEAVFHQVKSAGYDGIELTVPANDDQVKLISGLLKSYEMEVIAHEWANDGTNLSQLLTSYKKQIFRAATIHPLFINSHTGRDFFSFDDNCRLIEEAFRLEEETGVQINHEVHRGRFSFHCYSTAKYLRNYPKLSLTADFSHWCNVSESYLAQQQESLQLAIEHSRHIHARVGHPQSCQVSNPAAPEWAQALNHHLNWWDAIVAAHQRRNEKRLTITPEFGPPPYMVTLPFSQTPIANQWEINLWMMKTLKERYN